MTQGAAHEVLIALPDKVTINQVSGATVADWEMKDGQLAVTFLEPVEQNAKFIVSGETRSPRDGQIEIPLLRLLNTERDTGGVAVEVLGAGEINKFKTEGLENADATDLGEIVSSRQSTSLSAFRFRSGDAKTTRSLTVNVARYTPQAVLMANVAEARYNVLITNEGKAARASALRRSQQPAQLSEDHAAAGRHALERLACRQSPSVPANRRTAACCSRSKKRTLAKTRRSSRSKLVYISHGTAWNDKGQFKLALPALDLPVSRTGLLVYHPPLFKVSPEPGSFRTEAYAEPTSAALNPPPPPTPPNASKRYGSGARSRSLRCRSMRAKVEGRAVMNLNQPTPQTLVDNFRIALQGGKAAGILPIKVSFAALGPSLYLVSELTGENQSPSTNLDYQHEKKAGGR